MYYKIIVILLLIFNISYSQTDSTKIKNQKSINTKIDTIHNEIKILKSDINKKINLEVYLPLISAIIITFIGYLILRTTEFRKTVFQRRIDVFEDFLKKLEIYDRKSFHLIVKYANKNVNGSIGNEMSQEAGKIFLPVKLKSVVVKLLLNKKYRNQFEKIVASLNSNVINCCVDARQFKFEIGPKIKEIEKIFMKNLKNVKI